MESADAAERRRIRREELNRSLILDAAEQTFAEQGYKGASLREIAGNAGFSAAAVYLFFESKQHLYGETLVRRGTELREAMEQAGRTSLPARQRLHEMADVAIAYYRRWPNFGRLVAQARAMMLGYSVIVNTFLAVGASSEEAGTEEVTSGLTEGEMHEIIDGAFRARRH